jgi:carbon monoxide dehydrogenase subunit G
MLTRRTRVIAAPAQAIWAVVADPHHFPRWWPGVVRVEEVHEDRFTQVYTTKKGRAVRMDFRLTAREPPEDGEPGRVSFEQDVRGTPFERVLNASVTEVALEPAERGTRVTIEQQQRLRGYSRTGGLMLRRATGTRLQEALDGLERATAGGR